MTLGLSLSAVTAIHVVISLIAIVAGFIVMFGMLSSRPMPGLTAIFLLFTILTSVTGFMFPIRMFTPALAFGVLSLVVLAIAIAALYVFRLAGSWRPIYVVTALAALYLNVFVLVVQAFQKSEILAPLAPTQSEPPFLATEAVVLALFLFAGYRALKRFHPAAFPAAAT